MWFYLYQDARKEWRWRLYAENNKIVADSGEGYSAKLSAENAISLIKNYAQGARVVS